MVFFNPQLELTVIAFALGIVSQAVQIMFGNKRELEEHRKEMKKKQDKMKELSKSKSPDAKKELEKIEKEMMDSLGVMMKSMQKMMIFSFVIFVPAFFVLGIIYSGQTFGLPVPIPWFAPEPGFDLFSPFSWFSLYTQTNFVGWYALSSIFFSFVIITPLFKIYEKKRAEKNANT